MPKPRLRLMSVGVVASFLIITFRLLPGAAAQRDSADEPPSSEAESTKPVTSDRDDSATSARKFEGTRAGEQRDDNEMKIKFVWCPAGKFLMGSPNSEKDRRPNEDQVEVTLTRSFWMARTEVMQVEWLWIMKTRPWQGEKYIKEDNDCAATCVNWEDAMAFCKKLTEKERKAGRLPRDLEYTLPTEAQWEYACRAETTSRYSFGDDETLLNDYAWCDAIKGNRDLYAHQVGQKKPNPWGLRDMHGNAAEWCRDIYEDKLPGGTDPVVTSDGPLRVFRGGSWSDMPSWCRSALRLRMSHEVKNPRLGFRLAICPVQ